MVTTVIHLAEQLRHPCDTVAQLEFPMTLGRQTTVGGDVAATGEIIGLGSRALLCWRRLRALPALTVFSHTQTLLPHRRKCLRPTLTSALTALQNALIWFSD